MCNPYLYNSNTQRILVSLITDTRLTYSRVGECMCITSYVATANVASGSYPPCILHTVYNSIHAKHAHAITI